MARREETPSDDEPQAGEETLGSGDPEKASTAELQRDRRESTEREKDRDRGERNRSDRHRDRRDERRPVSRRTRDSDCQNRRIDDGHRSRDRRGEDRRGEDRRGEDRRRGEERGRNRREGEANGRHKKEEGTARGRGATQGRAAVRGFEGGGEAAQPNVAKDEEKPDANGVLEAAKPGAKAAGPAGGAYIPPFKLAQMMQAAESKTDATYQRMTWDALRKSINGLVNKVNAANVKPILAELFQENLLRGRGLFCQSIMKSQVASPTYTPVFAALVAVIGSKIPAIPELLVHRLIAQYRRSFKRNDRALCTAVVKFFVHLANQRVLPEIFIMEMIFHLLSAVTNDGVELAVAATKEAGALIQDEDPNILRQIFDEFRKVLQEGKVEPRVQYMVEGLFKIRADGFEKSGFPQIPEGLDLLEQGDEQTLDIELDAPVQLETNLNVFKADPNYEQNEKEYEAFKRELLGEESDDEDDDDDDDGDDDEDEEESDEEQDGVAPPVVSMNIKDNTETNLINLRRTIYLTIMSSMDFEEAGHKLMKIELAPGQEMEIVTMLIECCSQEKTYLRYYGLLAQRYCGHNIKWQQLYEECFARQYSLIHRLETNKLRNVARFFAHLLVTDSISWAVLSCVRITEDDTTSASRIFIKILFQDMSENMGLVGLNERLQDPTCVQWFEGIFPKDTPRNMRFSINFFTSIGLGGLTDKMRAHLAELPKILAQQAAKEASSGSDSSSDSDSDSDSSDSDGSSDSSSDSDSDTSSSDDSGSSSDDTSSSSSDTEFEEPPPKADKGGSKRKLPPPPPLPKAERSEGRRSSEQHSKRPRTEDRREDRDDKRERRERTEDKRGRDSRSERRR